MRWFLFLIIIWVVFILGFWAGGRTNQVPVSANIKPSSSVSSPASVVEPKATTAELAAASPDSAKIFAKVQRLSRGVTSEGVFDELLASLVAWSGTNPEAALDYARKNLNYERQNQAVTAVLKAVAEKNPVAAWDWVTANVPDNLQYVDTVIGQVARVDAKVAWLFAKDFAANHPADGYSGYASAVQGMAYAGNYAAATAAIEQTGLIMPVGNYDLPNLLVSQWARYDPAQAATWVKALPQGDRRDLALTQLGGAWAEIDPPNATEFALQLPAGSGRLGMMSEAIGKWVQLDPSAATAWVGQYAGRPDFDQVVLSMATLPSISDHTTAIKWARSLTDPELRTQGLATIFDRLWKANPEMAQAELQNTALLPAETKTEIFKRLKAMGN